MSDLANDVITVVRVARAGDGDHRAGPEDAGVADGIDLALDDDRILRRLDLSRGEPAHAALRDRRRGAEDHLSPRSERRSRALLALRAARRDAPHLLVFALDVKEGRLDVDRR